MFFKNFDENLRDIFNSDLDKFNILAFIIFNLNYSDSYKDLKENECYFSYSVLRRKFNMGASKLSRIIKELEQDNIIQWSFKSKSKNKTSIVKFCGFNYCEHEKVGMVKEVINRTVKETSKDIAITKVESNSETVSRMVNGTVTETLSKKQSKKQSIICSIFSKWNSKNIIVHKDITINIEKAIVQALKRHNETEILLAIDNYSEILESSFYYNYKFTLEKFLKQNNGIREFLEEGSILENYKLSKNEKNISINIENERKYKF